MAQVMPRTTPTAAPGTVPRTPTYTMGIRPPAKQEMSSALGRETCPANSPCRHLGRDLTTAGPLSRIRLTNFLAMPGDQSQRRKAGRSTRGKTDDIARPDSRRKSPGNGRFGDRAPSRHFVSPATTHHHRGYGGQCQYPRTKEKHKVLAATELQPSGDHRLEFQEPRQLGHA